MLAFFSATSLKVAVTQHRVKYVCNALLFLIKGSHKESLLLNITKWGASDTMSSRVLINCFEGLNHAPRAGSSFWYHSLFTERGVFLFNLHVTKYLKALFKTREMKKLLCEPLKISKDFNFRLDPHNLS